MEDVLIGVPPKVIPHNAEDVFDEFECLNLNITMPTHAPRENRRNSDLPVMVYIHGGGGFSGSNSDWFCDGAALVSQSLYLSKPIVHVAIKSVLH